MNLLSSVSNGAQKKEGHLFSETTVRQATIGQDRHTPTVYHIPVCPFSQRLEILLELKGLSGAVAFEVVDITKPRPEALMRKTRGTTALPVLETGEGGIVKESMVILQ